MTTTTPRWWRTLEEHAGRVDEASRDEFHEGEITDEPLVQLGGGRRDFFRMMGLSAAAAMAACKRAPVEHVLPLTRKPDEQTPGVALWYATTCGACPARCGLLVKTRDGRPIKIEGNPSHPTSKGAVCAVGQAAVLGLYDADRARGPSLRDRAGAWQQATFAAIDRAVAEGFAAAKGRAIRIVAPWGTGPSEDAALAALVAAHANAKVVRFDPLGERDAIALGHRALYGAGHVPDYRLDAATVLASFGADFLGTWLAPGPFARARAEARALSRGGRRLRHVQLESTMTVTGGAADERHALPPSAMAPALARLTRALSKGTTGALAAIADTVVAAVPAPAPPSVAAAVDRLAQNLREAGPSGLVLAGGDEPLLQALAATCNALLGNARTTAVLPGGTTLGSDELTMSDLADELERGEVGAIAFVGTNPVLALPALAAKIARVPFRASTADRLDETAALGQVHAPENHFLESWGDARPAGDSLSIAQPVVGPLFATRGRIATLLAWAGRPDADEHAFVRDRWASGTPWQDVVREGTIAATAPDRAPEPLAVADVTRTVQGLRAPPAPAATELVLHASFALRDGAVANNAWLQELPDPIAKVAWGNFAAIAPARAAALGIGDGDVIAVATSAGRVELPALRQPGLPESVVAIAVGYGRTAAGRNARGVGQDAFPMATWIGSAPRRAGATVTLAATGRHEPLAFTQTHPSQEGRELVREQTLADALGGKPLGGHGGHALGHSMWSGHRYDGHKWALAIDLDACTGCGACVVSCQAENNVPVVGAAEVRRRREMHWLRIDRYYGGTPDAPEVVHQPMMCQHCENAPCESVCPVLATVHSSEGLNQQVYNRCIGTRYCANNCPTKVRRFNWFQYRHDDDLAQLVLNPDVVVRSRGVMEKCSMCVQRIEEARATSRREGRTMRDGDVVTACQQSCPSRAIVFGDLNDPASAIAKAAHDGRAYRLLEELNIGPRVTYLARVTNDGGRHGT